MENINNDSITIKNEANNDDNKETTSNNEEKETNNDIKVEPNIEMNSVQENNEENDESTEVFDKSLNKETNYDENKNCPVTTDGTTFNNNNHNDDTTATNTPATGTTNDNANDSKTGNIIEPEQFRKVFIGGLSYKTDDDTLKSYFSKYGELVDYVVMKDSGTGRSRGFGFVTYAESFMVDSLMKSRPHIIDGRQVEPKRATPREDSGKAEVQMTVKKLFIGGLRDNVDENDLRNYFSQYGNVLEAVIMKEKDSTKSRGFGFVTFDDYDPVDKIILEKHHTINGINVHTQKALPKDFDKVQNTKPNSQNTNRNFHNQQNNFNSNNTNNGNANNYQNYNAMSNNSHFNTNGSNQNMPNLNTLAQMAASFFAAASANKSVTKSNAQSNPITANSMNNPNNNRSNFDNNFGYSSSGNMNNKPSNMNNHGNNQMNYLMNQIMNRGGHSGPPGNHSSIRNGNDHSGKMNTHMNPGPVRGGHGRFTNRSGPYNAPTGGNNFQSGNRGRMRGGNRNMGNRFNNSNNQMNMN